MPNVRWLSIACLLPCLALACKTTEESTKPSETVAEAPEAGVEQTRIRGTLLGHDGQPVPLAQIHASVVGHPAIEVTAAADGKFELELPVGPTGPAWASLRLTGVGHAEHTLEFLTIGGEHELEVRLGTYARPETLETLSGFGRFDGEGPRYGVEFERRDDGTWVGTLERARIDEQAKLDEGAGVEEFHYQLGNATSEGRTINGTVATRYVYDGGGDYFAVVPVPEAGDLEIVYDPAAMPKAGQDFALSFADPSSSVARMITAREDIAALREQTMDGFRAAMEAPDARPSEVLFAEAMADYRAELSAWMARAEDPHVRRMLLVAWAGALDRDDRDDPELVARVTELLEELGPRDPLWSMDDGAMARALAFVPNPSYFATAAAEHPDIDVGASLWVNALVEADEAGDLERGREAMKALAEPRFAETRIATIAKIYDPSRPTAPGQTVPDFSLRSIDGKTEYSASDLRGKTYVLDFWATWCGPCVAEMPSLHAAYASLNGQAPVEGRGYEPVAAPKIEIISVSFDHDAKVVAKFRKDEWPMPWAHAVPDAETHKRLSESFGIVGIPMMILVGPDGVILASSPRLDGGSLGEVAGALSN